MFLILNDGNEYCKLSAWHVAKYFFIPFEENVGATHE